MDILGEVEEYLAKKGTIYEPDFESGNLSFGQVINSEPVRMKIFLCGENILCFRSVLPFKPEAKKVNELFVAVNAVNGYIKFGKFVITGNTVYFENTCMCNTIKFKEDDIAFFLTASTQTTKIYTAPLSAINSDTLKLKDFMDMLTQES